jgi:hypothetical protein
MKNQKTKIQKNVEWDYAGLKNNSNFFGTQSDWNQTLISVVNMVSLDIHKTLQNGGADTVEIYSQAIFMQLISTIEYFYSCSMFKFMPEFRGAIGNRYKVLLKKPLSNDDLNKVNIVKRTEESEFIYTIEIKNLPEYKEMNTWDHDGLENNPEFFGTHKGWNATFVSTIGNYMKPNSELVRIVFYSDSLFFELFYNSELKKNQFKKLEFKCIPNLRGLLFGEIGVCFEETSNPLNYNKIELIYSDFTSSWIEVLNFDCQDINKSSFLPDDNYIVNIVKNKPNTNIIIWDYKGLHGIPNFNGTQKDWNTSIKKTLIETFHKIDKKYSVCIVASPQFGGIIDDIDVLAGVHYLDTNKQLRLQFSDHDIINIKISNLVPQDEFLIITNTIDGKFEVQTIKMINFV